ncbi:MAG: integration host factor subunit beta [Acidobacteria bacterium]|nr:integration host factor subunit beta [Acidobacteriota bacterium]
MTKAELVEEVARASELNKRDAEVIVETVFGSIINALHRGEKVELRGFGSFRTRERGPRRGRNPKTGAPVDVPAKRVPYFKPGKELKEFFTDGEEPQTVKAVASASENAAPSAVGVAPVSAVAPAREATEAASDTTETASGDGETTARPA